MQDINEEMRSLVGMNFPALTLLLCNDIPLIGAQQPQSEEKKAAGVQKTQVHNEVIEEGSDEGDVDDVNSSSSISSKSSLGNASLSSRSDNSDLTENSVTPSDKRLQQEIKRKELTM